ncbi:MAG: hypothetical protein Q7J98_13685 [Kiritimatiellia bacterium]|nr:hypothetical protein [Kiritimatiellia bacterium]
MGDIINANRSNISVRKIRIHVVGTNIIDKVEVLRNGKNIFTKSANGYSCDYTHEDSEGLDRIRPFIRRGGLKLVNYYLRVKQADGEMAWTSPVYIRVPGN